MNRTKWVLTTLLAYIFLLVGIVPRLNGSEIQLNAEFTAAILAVGLVALFLRDYASYQAVGEIDEIDEETEWIEDQEALAARPVRRRKVS